MSRVRITSARPLPYFEGVAHERTMVRRRRRKAAWMKSLKTTRFLKCENLTLGMEESPFPHRQPPCRIPHPFPRISCSIRSFLIGTGCSASILGGKLFHGLFGDEPVDGFHPEEWIASKVRALNENSTNALEGLSTVEETEVSFASLLSEFPDEMTGGQGFDVLVKALDSASAAAGADASRPGVSGGHFQSVSTGRRNAGSSSPRGPGRSSTSDSRKA